MNKMTSVVILNYNDSENVLELVNHVKNFENINYLVIVDNLSTDDSWVKITTLTDNKIHVISSGRNGGYGYGNNIGIKYSIEKLCCGKVLIVNPDVRFSKGCLKKLQDYMDNDNESVIVSCIQKNMHMPNVASAWKLPTSAVNHIISTSIILDKIFKFNAYNKSYFSSKSHVKVGCVQGAMLLVDSEKFFECGGYDEDMFLYGEEISLGLSIAKKGYSTVLLQDTFYEHYHSQSINKSFPDVINKRRLMHASKEIILKKNWNLNVVDRLLMRLIFRFNVLEIKIINFIRKM